MSERRQILEDKEFWLKLEYALSAWFRSCGDHSLGAIWCDGLTPSRVSNTQHGIDVAGHAWIGEGGRMQHDVSFSVSIPQRMLTRRRQDVVLTNVAFDLERKRLGFAVEPAIRDGGVELTKSSDDSAS